MDAELERFKQEINLPEVARAYGYAIDERESSRASIIMRRAGEKIVVATGEDGHGIYFSIQSGESGSVIDFVMHRERINLGHARQVLRPWVGDTGKPVSPPGPAHPITRPERTSHNRAALIADWQKMQPYHSDYLQKRNLSTSTITRFADCIRTDARGNTVFKHEDALGLSGWEIKNAGFNGFIS